MLQLFHFFRDNGVVMTFCGLHIPFQVFQEHRDGRILCFVQLLHPVHATKAEAETIDLLKGILFFGKSFLQRVFQLLRSVVSKVLKLAVDPDLEGIFSVMFISNRSLRGKAFSSL